MKRIVLSTAFVLLTAFSVSSRAQNTRFAVLTDLHIGNDGAEANLNEAIRSLDADPDTEFVLLLGDVSDKGDAESYRKAIELLSRLNKPLYVTTGNHDAKTPERYANFREAFGRGSFRFEVGGVRILGLPTGPTEAGRHATLAEDDAAVLAEACRDTLPVIVAAHHTPNLIAHGTQIFSGIDTRRIVLWLAGHTHRNSVQATVPGPSATNVSTLEGGRYNIVEITDGMLRLTTVAPRTARSECWYETRLF